MTVDTAHWNAKRVYFLGVNTGFVSDGEPDARYIDFYRQRSSARLYCAIVGNVVVPNGHGSNRSTAFLGPNPVWSELAFAIRAKGALPGIQLATAWDGYEGSRNFLSADGDQVIPRAKDLVRDFGIARIEGVLSSFNSAANLAVDHGFAHIQFHAAHGYLLSLLIDERICSQAERVREGLARISEGMRDQGLETSLRISMRTGNIDFDRNGPEQLQDTLADLPFDLIDLSSGFYNINKRLIYPSLEDVVTARLAESIEIARRNPARQFIVSGQISQQVSKLPENAQIGICRDLIANPRFLFEIGNGCRNHGKCHYFSRGAEHVTCPQWHQGEAGGKV